VNEHEGTLRGGFSQEVVEHTISQEFDTLQRTVSRDPVLKDTLEKAVSKGNGDFGKLGCQFSRGFQTYSSINYERDDCRSGLTNFSLEVFVDALLKFNFRIVDDQ